MNQLQKYHLVLEKNCRYRSMHAHLFEQTSSQNSKAASSFSNQKRCLDKLFVHHASRTNQIRRLANCTALALAL